MNIKRRIGFFFSCLCVSFTIIMLLYTALSGVMGASVNSTAVCTLFAVCAMVALVVSVISVIPINNVLLTLFIDFIAVFLTVFLFGGGVLGMFPFEWDIMLIVFGMLSAAYIGVVMLFLATEQIVAADINKKISEIKKENHREEK